MEWPGRQLTPRAVALLREAFVGQKALWGSECAALCAAFSMELACHPDCGSSLAHGEAYGAIAVANIPPWLQRSAGDLTMEAL